jgi:hypothetical protein
MPPGDFCLSSISADLPEIKAHQLLPLDLHALNLFQ